MVSRNVLFAQRRVAWLNLTRHAAATAICSRGSRGEGGSGRGLRDSSRGAWARQRLNCELALEAERVRGALEVLAERSAQPSLSWRGGYKANEMRVLAFGLLGAVPLA